MNDTPTPVVGSIVFGTVTTPIAPSTTYDTERKFQRPEDQAAFDQLRRDLAAARDREEQWRSNAGAYRKDMILAKDRADRAEAELARVKAEREAEREARESAERDVDLMAREQVYKGNSVQHWHNKATAYSSAIGNICDALRQAGMSFAGGNKSAVDLVRELAAEREADRKDADSWRMALPWLRTVRRLPFNLARHIRSIDSAIAAKGDK